MLKRITLSFLIFPLFVLPGLAQDNLDSAVLNPMIQQLILRVNVQIHQAAIQGDIQVFRDTALHVQIHHDTLKIWSDTTTIKHSRIMWSFDYGMPDPYRKSFDPYTHYNGGAFHYWMLGDESGNEHKAAYAYSPMCYGFDQSKTIFPTSYFTQQYPYYFVPLPELKGLLDSNDFALLSFIMSNQLRTNTLLFNKLYSPLSLNYFFNFNDSIDFEMHAGRGDTIYGNSVYQAYPYFMGNSIFNEILDTFRKHAFGSIPLYKIISSIQADSNELDSLKFESWGDENGIIEEAMDWPAALINARRFQVSQINGRTALFLYFNLPMKRFNKPPALYIYLDDLINTLPPDLAGILLLTIERMNDQE